MRLINHNIPLIISDSLACFPWLIHGISTRLEGVSEGPFSTLNLSYDVGDSKAHVGENRQKLKQALGIEKIISLQQVHGDQILEIRHNTIEDQEYQGYDAMITDEPKIGLLIKVADCQPVLIVDPESFVVANLHNGWRGSVANIVGKTVSQMKLGWGCQPARMRALIGPSLGPCCAEYKNHQEIFPAWFKAFEVAPNHFDFWAITVKQLTQEGLIPENIETIGLCSKCRSDLFYSHRGENGLTGRFGAIIGIRGI